MAAEKRIEIGPLGTQIRQSIRAYREAQRLPYTEVAKRLAEIGRPIPVLGLSRIEQGERRVDVDDLAALAKALRVPPALLLFPVGRQPTVEVLPGRHVDTIRALNWFAGEAPFTGEEVRSDDGSRRTASDPGDLDGWNRGGEVVWLFRQHQRQLSDVARARSYSVALRRRAESSNQESERAALLDEAADNDKAARSEERNLRGLRDAIRRHGAEPPELHPNWAFIDELPDDGSRMVLYPTATTFLGPQGVVEDAQD